MSLKPTFRVALCLLSLWLCLPAAALADDAGVLTESELGNWVNQLLSQTIGLEPQNAPIGEEALTEEGYAFIYPFATLYYNQPALDRTSVLRGFTVTDEAAETPRGLRLGSPVQSLIAAYGWQNPELYGDGIFAAFYRLSQLPQGAYWSWARLEGNAVASVQCAVHAAAGTLYTDAGVIYQAQDGHITAIRVYGLDQTITLEDVRSNLQAVGAVQAAGSGDEAEAVPPSVQGSLLVSEAEAFGEADLRFGGLDFLTLEEGEATRLFGAPLSEDWVADDTGEWMQTVHRDALTLTYLWDASRQSARLESLSIARAGLEGPRGTQIGDELEQVLARFRSDGTGETLSGEALLYGDGIHPPTGGLTLSPNGASLRYATGAGQDGAAREVTLRLTFQENRLTEILLYSW